jgi:hypothetical protein
LLILPPWGGQHGRGQIGNPLIPAVQTSRATSEDTVTEYLDEARRRYGVSRRSTLVLRAVFDGQIALSDVLTAPPS